MREPLAQNAINPQVTYRNPRPGDLGWVVYRHGLLYGEGHGWNINFEGLVSEVIAEFVTLEKNRNHCWIAVPDENAHPSEILGCIFIMEAKDPEEARLRLLHVEPDARGLGLGQTLVRESIEYSRAKGYKRVSLWTNSVLHSARRIYEAAGFRLVSEEKHTKFGPELTGQYWVLEL